MKTSKIAFWTALILGFVFFPAHMIMIGIFLILVGYGDWIYFYCS